MGSDNKADQSRSDALLPLPFPLRASQRTYDLPRSAPTNDIREIKEIWGMKFNVTQAPLFPPSSYDGDRILFHLNKKLRTLRVLVPRKKEKGREKKRIICRSEIANWRCGRKGRGPQNVVVVVVVFGVVDR